MHIERFKRRYWAVYDGKELVCVTVYKKGAISVAERLQDIVPKPARADELLPRNAAIYE